MATSIRLKRVGAKKEASYRIVVMDTREGTAGASIERLGLYNPRTQPSLIRLNAARTLHWLNEGAEPSDTVRSLLRRTGVWKQFHDGVTAESLEEEIVFLGPGPHARGTSRRPVPEDRPEPPSTGEVTEKSAAAEAAAEPATEEEEATTAAEETPQEEAEAAPDAALAPELETGAEEVEAEAVEIEAPTGEEAATEERPTGAAQEDEADAEAEETETEPDAETAPAASAQGEEEEAEAEADDESGGSEEEEDEKS